MEEEPMGMIGLVALAFVVILPTLLAIVTDRWIRNKAWYRKSPVEKLKNRLAYIAIWNIFGLVPIFYIVFGALGWLGVDI